jgi:hypothetical protein
MSKGTDHESVPRVTVVVPCYNYANYLPDAVGSALRQASVEVDVLIIDDASSDESARVARGLAAASPRVQVVHHHRNLGLVDTMNEGLSAATGEFVVKLDADDLLTPGSLARSTSLLRAHPSVGFVYGHPLHFSSGTPPQPRSRVRSWTIWSGHDWLARRCRRGVNCISNPEVVMRASALHQAGRLKVRIAHASDLELWLRLAAIADVARVNGPDQACYRIHAQSMSRLTYAGALNDLRGRWDGFAAAFAGPPGALHDAAPLYGEACRALARDALDRACRAYDRGRTSQVPVAALMSFAEEVWPDAQALPEWKGLERRRSIGPERCRIAPPFVGRAVTRRVGDELYRWRWRRSGV